MAGTACLRAVPEILAVVRQHDEDDVVQDPLVPECFQERGDVPIGISHIGVVQGGDVAPLLLRQNELALLSGVHFVHLEDRAQAAAG